MGCYGYEASTDSVFVHRDCNETILDGFMTILMNASMGQFYMSVFPARITHASTHKT